MDINDYQTDDQQTGVVAHPDVLELMQLEAELERLNRLDQASTNGELARLGKRIKQLHQQLQIRN